MEDILKAAVGQVPALVVLGVIVAAFLKHMKERDAIISEISKDSLEARRHSQSVIEKNSAIVGENTAACREMTQTMHELMRLKV